MITFLWTLASIFILYSCSANSDAAENKVGNINYEFWVTIEEAQEMAFDEGKYIVLDVYTDWCGFCRRMNRETYADEGVQDALDRFFYTVRINAESEQVVTFRNETYTMQNLAMKFGVQSFPTTIFITPEGELLALQAGFIEAQQFQQMLTYVGSQSYKSLTFQQFIESE